MSHNLLMLEMRVNLFKASAWTQRSRGKAAKRGPTGSHRSKEQTCMYMRPFLLNVFLSRKFIHAKVNKQSHFRCHHKRKRYIRRNIRSVQIDP
ncbi:hypothetical protein YC2023_012034 [Brassica napus]